jgi:hypothetical protein
VVILEEFLQHMLEVRLAKGLRPARPLLNTSMTTYPALGFDNSEFQTSGHGVGAVSRPWTVILGESPIFAAN